MTNNDRSLLKQMIHRGIFNYDIYELLVKHNALAAKKQIKKMGNIKDLMGMVPGMGQAVKDVDISNDSFKPIEAIIQSMTLKERQNPDLLNSSRKIRIAKGSGTSIQQVNNLMKQFEDMRKMMKMMNKVQDGKMKMPNMGNMLKR